MFDTDLIKQAIVGKWCARLVLKKILAIKDAALPIVELNGNLVVWERSCGYRFGIAEHG